MQWREYFGFHCTEAHDNHSHLVKNDPFRCATPNWQLEWRVGEVFLVLAHFLSLWSVWLWLFPQGASVGGTCAGTQPQANWLSQRKRKTEKKQLSQTQLPSSKIRQTTTRWVRVILGRGLQQPLLQQPALWNCAQVSRSLTFSEISNLETWSPTVLESLTHYSELLKTWRGSSSCRQLCNRTLAGPSLTRLVATSLSFLSRRALSYLTRRVWPPPSSPSWTARQPARPSWPRPSAEMLTPSALSLNDKWEAFDDDSRWC